MKVTMFLIVLFAVFPVSANDDIFSSDLGEMELALEVTFKLGEIADENGFLLSNMSSHRIFVIPYRGHARMKFNYSISPIEGGDYDDGRCIIYFAPEKQNRTETIVDYEVDRCSHETVFAQNERGTLRLGGNGEGWTDRITDQHQVVLRDSFTSTLW